MQPGEKKIPGPIILIRGCPDLSAEYVHEPFNHEGSATHIQAGLLTVLPLATVFPHEAVTRMVAGFLSL